jgi:hypothetical protein
MLELEVLEVRVIIVQFLIFQKEPFAILIFFFFFDGTFNLVLKLVFWIFKTFLLQSFSQRI